MKRNVKKLINCICLIFVLPFALLFWLTKFRGVFLFFGELLSFIPDPIGSWIRIAYYRLTLRKCSGEGNTICFGSFFTKSEVEIGKGVYIGGNCNIGMCIIGDHATIASNVCILSGKNQHGYKQIDVPIQLQPGIYQQISIGDNCWIGHGAIIMANLGKQNIVSPGTVITRDTNDYEVWAGNPAKLIKKIED